MLIDTGAQVSLIKHKAIQNQSLINTNDQITIKSIHGSEKTIGKINTNIQENNNNIPIELHVTNNIALKEDGILGYDFIRNPAIINGPSKIITLQSKNTTTSFPIEQRENISEDNEIKLFQKINYKTKYEISPHYQINLQRVKSITRHINSHKIKIN